jgi:hypothetical protein
VILIDYTINTTIKRKIWGITGALCTLVIPFFLMLQNNQHHLDTDQSLCPFKMLTGFPCPGCGITKSMVYFYDGNFIKSIHYHILGPFVILFCVATIVLLTIEILQKKEYFNKWLYHKKLAILLGLILGIYHLIRVIYFITQNSWHSIIQQSIWM